jgi:hypothetical protein
VGDLADLAGHDPGAGSSTPSPSCFSFCRPPCGWGWGRLSGLRPSPGRSPSPRGRPSRGRARISWRSERERASRHGAEAAIRAQPFAVRCWVARASSILFHEARLAVEDAGIGRERGKRVMVGRVLVEIGRVRQLLAWTGEDQGASRSEAFRLDPSGAEREHRPGLRAEAASEGSTTVRALGRAQQSRLPDVKRPRLLEGEGEDRNSVVEPRRSHSEIWLLEEHVVSKLCFSSGSRPFGRPGA